MHAQHSHNLSLPARPHSCYGISTLTRDVRRQGLLQWAPVKAALFTVLESPALQAAEYVIDAWSTARASLAVPSAGARSFLAVPASV